MKTTVLGAHGFVGSRLAHTLRQHGKEPWCPGRQEEPDLFRRPLGRVFYCAGLTADFRERPFDTIEAHVCLLTRLLRQADFERLVYLSSTRLYDSLGSIEVSEQSKLCLSSQDPRHLYDLSKALGENLCLTASDGRAAVARLSCVLGHDLAAPGFVPTLLRQCMGKNRVHVDSSARLERDYIGIDDVVTLLLAIAESEHGEVYNVASGVNTANAEVFELVHRLTGCTVVPMHEATAAAPRIDVRRIREEFSFSPAPLPQVLENMLAGAMPKWN